MNRLLKFPVCLLLSIAAGWGGRALALQLHRGQEATASAARVIAGNTVVGKEADAPDEEDAGDADLATKRAMARCTTTALWDLVESGKELSSDLRKVIAQELLDREGPASVVARCEGLANRERAGEWTRQMLEILAQRDCWMVLDFIRDLPADIARQGSSLASDLLEAAGGTSPEALIRMLDELKDKAEDFRFVSYPAGFDFRKVVDHVAVNEPGGAGSVPSGLIEGWAEHSPLGALEWARAHPDYAVPDYGVPEGEDPDAHKMSGTKLVMLSAAYAGDEGPERSKALLRAAQYLSPGERASVWDQMGGSYSSVNLYLAKIAAEIGPEDVQRYLVKSLTSTRGHDSRDPDWAKIPAELREPAMAQALEEWRKQDPTPSGDQSREQWKAAMERLFKR